MHNLDSDLLRTFLAINDAGSFIGGAAIICRSQAAASLQIRKLEDLLGTSVFERHGRGVYLTKSGERLEQVAREVVQKLDRAKAEIMGSDLEGELKIGMPDDCSEAVLSRIIAVFTRIHPKVELTVQCALSCGFSDALQSGGLDIAVNEVEKLDDNMEFLREEQLAWVMLRGAALLSRETLPVAIYNRECWWRQLVLTSLQSSKLNFRAIYSSESTTGITAAIRSGIAIGIMKASALNDHLVLLSQKDGFQSLPKSKLVIEYGNTSREDTKLIAMADIIRNTFL